MSPTDLSIDERVESGVARKIANIPKERRRMERAEHFSVLESEYLWPRAAAGLIWLRQMPVRAQQCYMVTEFRPKPLPMAETERIEVERHELAIGTTTPAHLLAAKTGMSVDDAKQKILAMRKDQLEISAEDEGAGQTVDPAQVPQLIEVVKAATDGSLPLDSAKATLKVVWRLDDNQIDSLLGPVEEKQAAEKEQVASTDEHPEPEPAQAPPGPSSSQEEPKRDGTRSLVERLATAKTPEETDVDK